MQLRHFHKQFPSLSHVQVVHVNPHLQKNIQFLHCELFSIEHAVRELSVQH